jgi:hypothetical protein
MHDHLSPRTRRAALRTLTVGAAVVAFPALLGCAPSPSKPGLSKRSATGGGAVTAPAGALIMVIRHGEKPATKSAAGIDLNGLPDTHSLTEQGWMRAAYLPDLFAPADDGGGSVLPTPTVIYASGQGQGDGEGTRPRQTVGPLAAALGIVVDTTFSRGQEADLVAAAASEPGPVLICWQHQSIPAIGAAFGNVSPAPPDMWPDDQYDMVWAFGSTGDGWQFAQVSEGLLPGDSGVG